jgi:hypothetical protein
MAYVKEGFFGVGRDKYLPTPNNRAFPMLKMLESKSTTLKLLSLDSFYGFVFQLNCQPSDCWYLDANGQPILNSVLKLQIIGPDYQEGESTNDNRRNLSFVEYKKERYLKRNVPKNLFINEGRNQNSLNLNIVKRGHRNFVPPVMSFAIFENNESDTNNESYHFLSMLETKIEKDTEDYKVISFLFSIIHNKTSLFEIGVIMMPMMQPSLSQISEEAKLSIIFNLFMCLKAVNLDLKFDNDFLVNQINELFLIDYGIVCRLDDPNDILTSMVSNTSHNSVSKNQLYQESINLYEEFNNLKTPIQAPIQIKRSSKSPSRSKGTSQGTSQEQQKQFINKIFQTLIKYFFLENININVNLNWIYNDLVEATSPDSGIIFSERDIQQLQRENRMMHFDEGNTNINQYYCSVKDYQNFLGKFVKIFQNPDGSYNLCRVAAAGTAAAVTAYVGPYECVRIARSYLGLGGTKKRKKSKKSKKSKKGKKGKKSKKK